MSPKLRQAIIDQWLGGYQADDILKTLARKGFERSVVEDAKHLLHSMYVAHALEVSASIKRWGGSYTEQATMEINNGHLLYPGQRQ